jgi:hypothetical protein
MLTKSKHPGVSCAMIPISKEYSREQMRNTHTYVHNMQTELHMYSWHIKGSTKISFSLTFLFNFKWNIRISQKSWT